MKKIQQQLLIEIIRQKECMITNKVQIKNTRYYQIINRFHNKALYISSGSKDFQSQKAYLDEINQQSLGQVWQIIEVNPGSGWKKDLFQFVHTRSTLVLTRTRTQFFLKKLVSKTQANEVRLKFGQWGANQLFYLQQVNSNDFPNIYRFVSSEYKNCYLYFHNYLQVSETDPNNIECHWQIRPCLQNKIINRSCYLENAYSIMAMDVPAGSTKTGCQLIQWPLNNRFNQRFNIYKSGIYYKIANLNSKLFLTVSSKPHLGELVKQQNNIDQLHQMWNLQYQGKNLYVIRSVKNPEFSIGIKDHVLAQETPLVLSNNQKFCLWRIIGFVPH